MVGEHVHLSAASGDCQLAELAAEVPGLDVAWVWDRPTALPADWGRPAESIVMMVRFFDTVVPACAVLHMQLVTASETCTDTEDQ
jgi:hypothetical protein